MKPSTEQQIAAYERVLEAVLDGIVDPSEQSNAGGCVYDNSDYAGKPNFCAVGVLFTQAQLDDIRERGLNDSTNVDGLADIIGKANIEATTGLTLANLVALQDLHDRLSASVFRGLSPAAAQRQLQAYLRRRIRRLSA